MLGIFLDTETNGLDWTCHTILEISFIIKNLITGKLITSYNSLITPTKDEWKNSDPDSLSYTKITPELLNSDGKKKLQVRKEILEIFEKNEILRGKAVFICQNPSFDRIFFSKIIEVQTQERLNFPYYWLDLASMYWCKRINEPNSDYIFDISKDEIANHYDLPAEEKPHRAKQGVCHLIKCYESVVGFPKTNFL